VATLSRPTYTHFSSAAEVEIVGPDSAAPLWPFARVCGAVMASVLAPLSQNATVVQIRNGSFDVTRNFNSLFGDATQDNMFIVKVNYWLGL
jgi:hypothetical protein